MRPIFAVACALFTFGTAAAQTPPGAAPAETAADPGAPTGILPDTATPIAYRLDFTILPDTSSFSGHTEIDVTLNEAASSVYLHGRDLTVSRATATAGGQSFPVTFEQVNPFGLATVDFGRELPAGRVTLTFDYEGNYTQDVPSGLYRVKAGDDWYSWTQFESIDARKAFPSFDQPGYKTPFTVSIATAPGNVAVSNTPETSSETEGNLVRHHFATTPPLPTYLVALITGPFVTAETMIPPTPQRATPMPLRIVATRPNAERMQYALDESGPIVALLESYFDQPFPFPKLDQIGSPVMPGAMENAGADVYGDDILLLAPDATPADKRTFGMVVAHELSHQWFGDNATPKWWDDIWLNESFANWMGYRIANEWKPDLDIGTGAISEGFEAMDLDSLTVGRPIHERITSDADVDSAFDQITYGKGGQVVAMIAEYLGDEKFQAGVRLHMQRHAYGSASTDDFFDSLATAADDPRVLDALRSFVDQQGVPVVTLHRQGSGYVASQAPYAFLGTTPAPREWIVPLCMHRGDADRECTLLDQPSQTVANVAGNGPLMPNAGGQGYYRFDLDAADWDALIADSASLPAGEAIALTDSLWAAFHAGKDVPVSRLVSAARAMVRHSDPTVALDNGYRLGALTGDGLISDAALPAFQATIAGIYRPVLDTLGTDLNAGAYPGEDPVRSDLRRRLVSIVSGAGHDAALRETLIHAADAYLAGDDQALAPSFLGSALGLAVADRGVPFATQLAQKALDGDNGALRSAAFSAITGSGNAEVARWFLNDFNDSRVRPGEKLFGLYGLLGSAQTRDLAFDYLMQNFASMARGGGGIFFARAGGAFAGFCSMEKADQIEQTILPVLDAAGGGLSLRRAIEQVRNCATFKDARADAVSQAFLRMQR